MSSTYLSQSMFPPRQDKDPMAGLYGSKPPSSYIPSMSGLSTGMQGLSLHQQGSRILTNTVQPFGAASRSASTPVGYSGMSGVSAMAGMSPLGAPSPPPVRNNMLLGSTGLSSSQGLGSARPGRPNSLASAIGSGLQMNSYGGLGGSSSSSRSSVQSLMNPFPSSYGNSLSDASGQSFDPAEFPVLGTRLQQDSVFSASGPLPSRPGGYGSSFGAGQLSKPVESTPEFQMRGEDFPALPGTSSKPTSDSADLSQDGAFPVHVTSTSSILPESRTTTLTYDPAPGSNKERVQVTNPIGPPPKTVTRKTVQQTAMNIPPGMVQDQFGMMGLLTFIRGAETDPTLVALALGSDLTTLGLNLNSPESLYSTFASPFADGPSRPQDIDFSVPQEYLIHSFIREKLAPIRLHKYNEDLLFFLYYTSGGDLLQVLAAHELYSRDWRYHKEERIWITRAPGMKPSKGDNSYEEGTYCYFDVNSWRKAHKELRVEYDRLEERPQIPPALATQQIVSTIPINV